MRILDLYIIRKFLSTFFFVIFIFVLIAIVFDISEKVDNFINSRAPLQAIIFEYYFTFIPYLVMLLAPLFIFITVIFFTAKMASQSETVALYNGGVSFYRMLLPYFVAASILAVMVYVINSWILPPANKIRVDFDNEYLRSDYVSNKRHFHYQDPGNPEIHYYLKAYNTYDSSGTQFAIERIREGEIIERLVAKRIKWNSRGNKWTLMNFNIREFKGDQETFSEGIRTDSSLAILPSDFDRPLDEDISQMNDAELRSYIVELRKKGKSNVAIFEVEKHKRYSNPFSTFILTLIGVSLASRKTRGGIGVHVALGVGLSFGYILLMQFSTIFAVNTNFSPFLAAWFPAILFGFIAVYLMRIAPK